jgi:N-acetylglucosamine-6-phosphate deacetylase
MMKVIKNAKVFNGEAFIPISAVAFCDGIVTRLYENYAGSDAYDAGGAILAPGFVDLHIHGSFGKDVLMAGGTQHLMENLPSVGTTSFCPTSATAPFEMITDFLGEVAALIDLEQGTRILGAHIEGPFFTERNRGAHATELLKDPTIANYEKIVGEYEDVVLRLSLAPELPGGMELISKLATEDVVLSAAHTDAMAGDMEEAISRGLTMATHTFNGFFPVHHREENGIAAVLTDDRIICEFIPDLQHISKYAARLIMAAKGYEKTFICSDALAPAHMPDGEYMLSTTPIVVKDAVATNKADGRLAGSTISVLQGVKKLVEIMKTPLDKALRMGTLNPARAIESDFLGKITVGAAADFVLLDPSTLDLKQTYIRGHLEYEA